MGAQQLLSVDFDDYKKAIKMYIKGYKKYTHA